MTFVPASTLQVQRVFDRWVRGSGHEPDDLIVEFTAGGERVVGTMAEVQELPAGIYVQRRLLEDGREWDYGIFEVNEKWSA